MFCAFWVCDIFGKNIPWEYISDKVLIKALISAESWSITGFAMLCVKNMVIALNCCCAISSPMASLETFLASIPVNSIYVNMADRGSLREVNRP